jgi:hypothetical protein
MRLSLVLLLAACSGPSSPQRPDFLDAETVNVKVTSIQFLTDREVAARLDDLATVARTEPEHRVRDQVALRLLKWGDPRGIPLLAEIYRGDAHHEVARAALGALTELCAAQHGRQQASTPPAGPISPPCQPVYDGSRHLPPLRPVPRLDAAAFWAAEGVAVKTLSNGEVWPSDDDARRQVFARYADPVRSKARKRWP